MLAVIVIIVRVQQIYYKNKMNQCSKLYSTTVATRQQHT